MMRIILIFYMISGLSPNKLFAQIILNDTLKWDVGLNIKSTNLQLADVNELISRNGFIPIDNYTQEINLYLNTQLPTYKLGISFSFSNGGSTVIATDKSSFSNIRVSYFSAGIFRDLIYKRIMLRGLLFYETANYRGDLYNDNTATSATMNNLIGSTITNQSKGVKPTLQFFIQLGQKRKTAIGIEWSYFYRLSQTGWTFFPSGMQTNLTDLKNGEQALSLALLRKFYK